MMKKRKLFFLILFTILTLLPLIKTQSSEVSTNLEIPYGNLAPSFSGEIPNQTWAINTDLINSINLNNYFSDNESITFNVTAVENITVSINQTSGYVSFYPDLNFEGIKNITFSAKDGVYTSSSNIVFLNVTQDITPPQWSNPRKDKEEIYQNTFVNFYTDWADNIELKSYIFSIRQNGAWVNTSEYALTSTTSISDYYIQISGTGGSTVKWYFTAKDTSGNSNMSEIQSFTVLSAQSPSSNSSSSSGSSSSNGGATTTTKTVESQLQQIKNFKVDPATSFKIDLKQGQTSTISIKITNTGNQNLNFNIDITGLEGFEKVISEKNFTLETGKSKTIIIELKAGKFLNPDIYLGAIKVSAGSENIEIPITIQVNELITDYALELKLDQDSKEIRAGENIVGNLTIYNLKDIEEKNIRLYYAIRDYQENLINFKEENFTFNKKVESRIINLNIDQNTEIGEYIFYARADIGGKIMIASDIFEVGERFNLAAFLKTNILLIALFMIMITISIFIIKYRRDKERLRILNLYVMIKEMKSFLDDGKLNEAIEAYIKIKRAYGEKIPQNVIENKEDLKKEMEMFTSKTKPIYEQEVKKENIPQPIEKIDKNQPEDKKENLEKVKTEEKMEESKIKEKKPLKKESKKETVKKVTKTKKSEK